MVGTATNFVKTDKRSFKFAKNYGTMSTYKEFASYYDEIMGDRKREFDSILKLIQRHAPGAEEILDIACGTGAFALQLSRKYEVTGLDSSSPMLTLAKRRARRTAFVRADMRSFKFAKRFDVALCLFDSINHLSDFSDWKKVFRAVRMALKPGGVFIFDINTRARLETLSKGPPWVKRLRNSSTSIFTVRRMGAAHVTWNVRIFAKQRGKAYRLIEENIEEVSFSKLKIIGALKKIFGYVRPVLISGKPAVADAGRIFFVCRV